MVSAVEVVGVPHLTMYIWDNGEHKTGISRIYCV